MKAKSIFTLIFLMVFLMSYRCVTEREPTVITIYNKSKNSIVLLREKDIDLYDIPTLEHLISQNEFKDLTIDKNHRRVWNDFTYNLDFYQNAKSKYYTFYFFSFNEASKKKILTTKLKPFDSIIIDKKDLIKGTKNNFIIYSNNRISFKK